jgi:hypothetical protein
MGVCKIWYSDLSEYLKIPLKNYSHVKNYVKNFQGDFWSADFMGVLRDFPIYFKRV